MASTLATVVVMVLGWVVIQQAAQGTLRQWLAAKFLNAAEPSRPAPQFSTAPPRAQHQHIADDGEELPFGTGYSGLDRVGLRGEVDA